MGNRYVLRCMAPDMKEALLSFIDDPSELKEAQSAMGAMPDCGGPMVGFDEVKEKEKRKREPSAYNLFVGSCLKERPEGTKVTDYMKSCAIKWKEKKTREGKP